MMAKKRTADDERPDISHQPTRKVAAMSTMAAEMLVSDTDATSPGIPALDVDSALASADNSGAHADEAALAMARLIEVRSVPPPAPRGMSPAEESAAIHAFRRRSPRLMLVLAIVTSIVAVAAAAYLAAANS